MAFFQVDVQQQNTIAASPADRNRAMKTAFERIGQAWHHKYKMLKFTDGAARRYGLTPRKGEPGSGRAFRGSYTEAKLKRHRNGRGAQAIGETKPFVWEGRSRNDAKASTKVIARAKRGFGSADCIINAPALNLKPKSGRINVREEFERVTAEEVRDLEKYGIQIYQALLSAKKYTRVRSYKG